MGFIPNQSPLFAGEESHSRDNDQNSTKREKGEDAKLRDGNEISPKISDGRNRHIVNGHGRNEV